MTEQPYEVLERAAALLEERAGKASRRPSLHDRIEDAVVDPTEALRAAATRPGVDEYDSRTLLRIAAAVEIYPSGCLVWRGNKTAGGYGRIKYRGVQGYAHRVAYALVVGPVPDMLQLDHLCRTTSCVNPAHLEPVTAQENTLRGLTRAAANSIKTDCPKGHKYDETNTYVDPSGKRSCKTCRRTRNRIFMRSYAARKRGGR